MIKRVVVPWIFSSTIFALIFPDRFFFLFFGIVFTLMMLLFTLILALGDFLMAKVNVKYGLINVIFCVLTSLFIALILGGTWVVGIVVGSSNILVNKLSELQKWQTNS